MTIYLPYASVANWQHAQSLGVRGVEFITGRDIGSPKQNTDDAAIDYSINFVDLYATMLGLRADTELLILDVTEGAMQQELKRNTRGEIVKVAEWMGRVYRLVQSYRSLPTYFDGVPSGARYWQENAIAIVTMYTGIEQFHMTAYWNKDRTLNEYIDGCKTVWHRANTPSHAPAVAQLSFDKHMSGLGESVSDDDMTAVFGWMWDRGIKAIAGWANPADKLPESFVERIAKCWNQVRS